MVTPTTNKRLNTNRKVMNNQLGQPDRPVGQPDISLVFIKKIKMPGVDVNITSIPDNIGSDGLIAIYSRVVSLWCILYL
jgi:hypothetical protein